MKQKICSNVVMQDNGLKECRRPARWWFVGFVDKVYHYLCDDCRHQRAYRHLNPQPMEPSTHE